MRAGRSNSPRSRRLGADASWKCLAVMCCWAVAATALATVTQPVAAAEPRIRVLDVSGKIHTGTLLGLTSDQLTLGGERARKLATSDLLRVDFTEAQVNARPGPVLLLSDGDRLGIEVDELTDVFLAGHWKAAADWPRIKVPLEQVRGFVLRPPLDRAGSARLELRLMERTTREDLLLFTNQDTQAGELLGLSQGQIELRTGGTAQKVDVTTVKAVGLNPELVISKEPAPSPFVLSLTDGSRWQVRRLQSKDGRSFHIEWGGEVLGTLPATALASIQWGTGRIIFLSDLTPEYHFEPYLDQAWPWRRDRSVGGAPLRLEGRTYAKGLGVHSQSELTYPINGAHLIFRATVGVDEEAQDQGRAQCEVLVDGRVVWTSPILTGGGPPVEIPPIDLRQAQRLTLRTLFGPSGDVGDHINWCDALLIR